MDKTKLVVLGAGNGYWEICELVNDINRQKIRYELIGVLDDRGEIWDRL